MMKTRWLIEYRWFWIQMKNIAGLMMVDNEFTISKAGGVTKLGNIIVISGGRISGQISIKIPDIWLAGYPAKY